MIADSIQVKSSMSVQVPAEGIPDGIENARTQPLAVVTVAGLVGGVRRGQIIPRGVGGDLPEDAFQQQATIKEGVTRPGRC
jgi:hypothetical protein